MYRLYCSENTPPITRRMAVEKRIAKETEEKLKKTTMCRDTNRFTNPLGGQGKIELHIENAYFGTQSETQTLNNLANNTEDLSSNQNNSVQSKNDLTNEKELNEQLNNYVSYLRTGDKSEKYVDNKERAIKSFLESIDYDVTEQSTIEYLVSLNEKYENKRTRKNKIQHIRGFLVSHLGLSWAESIEMPNPPRTGKNKNVNVGDIEKQLQRFKEANTGEKSKVSAKVAYLIGASTGLRASQIYRLDRDQINLDERTIYLPEDKNNLSRRVIFNKQTREAIERYDKYLKEYREQNGKDNSDSYIPSLAYLRRNTEGKTKIHLKDTRNFFVQYWKSQGGDTEDRRELMGRLKNDIDRMHYRNQDLDALRESYDEVMPDELLDVEIPEEYDGG